MRRAEIIERTRTWGKENDMKLNITTGGRASLRKGERQQRRKRMG